MLAQTINWISIIVCFVAAGFNLYGFIKGGRVHNELAARLKQIQDDFVAWQETQHAWLTTRRKWIDRRRGQIHRIRDARLAAQYLDELNELQKSLETVSSKINSPMQSEEIPG